MSNRRVTTGRNSVREVAPGMFFGGVEVTDDFFNGIVRPDIQSRLTCHCVTCKYKASRREFYKSRPGRLPSFDDVCPKCRGTNVDVIDPIVEKQVGTHHEEHGAYVTQKREYKKQSREGSDFHGE